MSPTAARPLPEPRLALFQRWLERERGLRFDDYDSLWRWSVTDLDAFWQAIWDHFGVESPTPHHAVLAEERMPGARWCCPGWWKRIPISTSHSGAWAGGRTIPARA